MEMTNKNTSTMDILIYTNLQWHLGAKKIKATHTYWITGKVVTKRLCMQIQKIPTTNTYDGFKADELDAYGDYKQPWKLDSGASGHYADPKTGVRNKQKKRNGIKVLVADGNNMDQIEEGRAPFD